MSLQIMTNELALNAQRHLEQTSRRLHKTLERLSSGSRIVHASDDAAGLAISDTLNAQTRSLGQAMRNANDGIGLIQVYESGTTEMTNMVMRVRELAMQSASDTVGERERSMLEGEVGQLKQEIDRVARTAKWADKELLSGQATDMEFQVGTGNNSEVDRILFNPGNTDLTLNALGLGDISVSTKEGAQEALDPLDRALYRITDIRAKVGAVQSRLNTTLEAQSVYQENLLAAKSRIRDADLAAESTSFARETILRKAGVAVLMQANETPSLALQLLRT